MSARVWPAALLAALLPAAASADQVFLKNGGHLDGLVVERTEARLTLEVGPGRVSLPMDRVVRIVPASSALSGFQARARGLAWHDLRGWLELALWARDHDLGTQARQAFEHVTLLDPRNSTAEAALGNVLVSGRWMSPDEANSARGLVRYGGDWMTPQERDERFREDAATERARIEAAARAREAAERAEAAAQAARAAEASSDGGIPFYGYGFGGYGFGFPVLARCPTCRHTATHRTHQAAAAQPQRPLRP